MTKLILSQHEPNKMVITGSRVRDHFISTHPVVSIVHEELIIGLHA